MFSLSIDFQIADYVIRIVARNGYVAEQVDTSDLDFDPCVPIVTRSEKPVISDRVYRNDKVKEDEKRLERQRQVSFFFFFPIFIIKDQ